MLTSIALFVAALGTAPINGAGNAEIAPGVVLIPGRFVAGTQPDGNTVMIRGRRGLIVVDTGRHADHAQAIIDLARKVHAPVDAIVNTHWHLDHIGGNALLRREYPAVHVYGSSAYAEARHGFLRNYRAQLEELIAKADDSAAQAPFRAELELIDSGDALAPGVVVSRSATRRLAGRRMVMNLESHAVTAGDLWLFDPATRVLISGDLVTLPVPFFDTACPANWQTALDHLAKVDFRLLVPGHGAPMSRSDFETYRAAYRNLVACGTSTRAKKDCIQGWMNDAASLVAGEDPRFVRSLLDYYIDSSLRANAATTARLCGDVPAGSH